MFVSWIPTKRTLRTVVSVFPYVLHLQSEDNSSFAIASNEPILFQSEQVLTGLRSAAVRDYLDASGEAEMAIQAVERFLEHVKPTMIGDGSRGELEAGDMNTDLFPRDEFDKSYDATYR